MNMATIDIAIVVLYFGVVIFTGFCFARKAANSLNDYFLGGTNIRWPALARSGISIIIMKFTRYDTLPNDPVSNGR
jgi:Na+/proline symporter